MLAVISLYFCTLVYSLIMVQHLYASQVFSIQ
jgi:hypothetical protein